jgi:hypothetical protein
MDLLLVRVVVLSVQIRLLVSGALVSNTTSNYNTSLGYQAGYNSVSQSNTYGGYQAGYNRIQVMVVLLFIGYRAGYGNGQTNSGDSLTAFGTQAAYSNAACGVTAIGANALYANTTGANNTAVGVFAGNYVTTGSGNTLIGAYSGQYGGGVVRLRADTTLLLVMELRVQAPQFLVNL